MHFALYVSLITNVWALYANIVYKSMNFAHGIQKQQNINSCDFNPGYSYVE